MTNTKNPTQQNNEKEEKKTSLLGKLSEKKEAIKGDKKNEKKEMAFSMLTPDDGINLVPIMTKSEVVKEERKSKMNITAILSIVVFLAITFVVVAFSTLTKLQVENEKKRLKQYEEEASVLSEKIISNDEVLKRIFLYRDISSSQYSAKDIFDYFSEIAIKNRGTILSNFIFTSNTAVSFEGECSSLECVAKFWHLLASDRKVESVTLDSVSKRSLAASKSEEREGTEEQEEVEEDFSGASFEFRVTMTKDAFTKDGKDSDDNIYNSED